MKLSDASKVARNQLILRAKCNCFGTPTVFASHAPLKKGRLIVEFRIVEDARG